MINWWRREPTLPETYRSEERVVEDVSDVASIVCEHFEAGTSLHARHSVRQDTFDRVTTLYVTVWLRSGTREWQVSEELDLMLLQRDPEHFYILFLTALNEKLVKALNDRLVGRV